ncbi:Cephalosporin-C deacetylase [Verrucomicrobium sp. GAS474]|uniref:acetylxylan esterase n=1 Tax=Verrucomicrobium sp. GAS474 TaxID=1882831 RepID=UPI00087DC097|nr:acetylxylan esterase [Verrucomicrobium sp. GAS474]SDT88634.1 Cephalosporin-C deacetylase [Verrucomicrobium sp. GAS474]
MKRRILRLLLTPLLALAMEIGYSTDVVAASSSDGKTPAETVLTVTADRPDALYHQGETVTFNISLLTNQQPVAEGAVEWTLTKDGVLPPLDHGTATVHDGKASITGTMSEPGFLHCEAKFKSDKGLLTAISAGGIDPTLIKPSLPVPDDFDAFWDAKKKELAAVPMNTKLTPVPPPANRSGVETFEFQADSIGNPVMGFYGRPIGAAPKSLPALLFVPGAGVRSANLDGVAGWAKNGNGMLVADINAHGIPNGQPGAFYGGLDGGELKDYRVRGRDSRDTYYFLGVHYRSLRALQFLMEQPEWDGKTLILIGGSQGGGLAFAAAALEPRVTYMIAFVPGLSDHSGFLAGRIAGWPKIVPKGADGQYDPKVTEAMRYFDTSNFATRIKIPAHVEVGFLDVICPPTCGYLAYNNLAGKKEIVNHVENGHDIGPQIWNDSKKLTLAHIAEQAKTP